LSRDGGLSFALDGGWLGFYSAGFVSGYFGVFFGAYYYSGSFGSFFSFLFFGRLAGSDSCFLTVFVRCQPSFSLSSVVLPPLTTDFMNSFILVSDASYNFAFGFLDSVLDYAS
jgi:hypothetical protein